MPKSSSLLSQYLFSLSTRVLNLATSHSQEHVSPYTPLPIPAKGISALEAGPEALRMHSQPGHSVLLCHVQSSKPLEELFSFRQWPHAEAGTLLAARAGTQQGLLSHLLPCEVSHYLSTDCSCNYHSTSTSGKVTYHQTNTVINISHKDC